MAAIHVLGRMGGRRREAELNCAILTEFTAHITAAKAAMATAIATAYQQESNPNPTPSRQQYTLAAAAARDLHRLETLSAIALANLAYWHGLRDAAHRN